MLSDAQKFWDAISGKVRKTAKEESKNAFRCERYTVTTAPNGTSIGVTLPLGEREIHLPYSKEVSTATVGDTVLVVWWNSMSNAKAYYFANGYEGVESGSDPLDAYPVGSYYWSSEATSPASLFGGNWEPIEDTFILAAGSTYTAGDTGGAATHTHTTGDHTLTVDEMPSHTHALSYESAQAGGTSRARVVPNGGGSSTSTGGAMSTGGDGAHNHGDTGSASNLPPYITAYCWHRIA